MFGPGSPDVTDDDCSAVRYICECVSRRAGFMAAAGITALLKKMDYKDVVNIFSIRIKMGGGGGLTQNIPV